MEVDHVQEVSRTLLAAGCRELVRKDAPIEPALQLMDNALALSPFLRVHAVSRNGKRPGLSDRSSRGFIRGRPWRRRVARGTGSLRAISDAPVQLGMTFCCVGVPRALVLPSGQRPAAPCPAVDLVGRCP